MADTNTYNSFQKVEKWTTEEKFNALDLATIEAGTEYNLTGQIGANDLDSELLVGINGKLTAPTNPLKDSVVTMRTDGKTGTKPLTDFEPFKYTHYIEFTINLPGYTGVYGTVVITNNDNNSYVDVSNIPGICTLHLGNVLLGICSLRVHNSEISLYGVVIDQNTGETVILNESNINDFSMTDAVTP